MSDRSIEPPVTPPDRTHHRQRVAEAARKVIAAHAEALGRLGR